MKRTALPFLLGCLFVVLLSATGVSKSELFTVKPAFPTSYHVKLFDGDNLADDVEEHIISFYRKGYVLKSNSFTVRMYGTGSGVVVMEKY